MGGFRVIFVTWISLQASLLFSNEPVAVVSAFVEEHCATCHDDETAKGELDLLALKLDLENDSNRNQWIRIFDRIESGEMPPPEKADDLTEESRAAFLETLGASITMADRADIMKDGRGQLRRLTQSEYQDNLRDVLLLPHLEVANRIPADRSAHGYSKVAALLDMSRIHLDAYLDAAGAALGEAVAEGVKPGEPEQYRFSGTDLFPSTETFGGREAMFFCRNGKWVSLTNRDLQEMAKEERSDPNLELALFRSATWPYYGYPRGFKAPRDGEYRVRFSGRAVRQLPGFRLVPDSDPLPMSFRSRQPSGPDVSGDVQETGGWMDLQAAPKTFQTTVLLKAGETIEYSLLGLPVPFIRTDGGFFYDFPPMPPDGHRGAAIQWLEIRGPIQPGEWPPSSHSLLFGDLPLRSNPEGRLAVDVVSENPRKDAEHLLFSFANKAARRPVSAEDLVEFRDLIFAGLDQGKPFAEAILSGYQAFLCSGHFLYLTEPEPGDRYSVASRLSHFLWNSRPDDALLSGELSVRSEAQRMIEDSRFERFVENFTGQWLDLRELRRDIPDQRLYPEYRKDDYLVASMEKETHVFFLAMVRENLPATTLVDCDFTFLNDRLARHYGLPREVGSKMRAVSLPEWSPYGGLLTQGSVLKLTSNGTTTSPVLRGAWVMERLLGDPPPPPPKTVPAIQPDIRGATTIRDLLGKHTESKACAACHARFDPVGFALENFDVMGAWRDRYRGLEKGEKITGFDPAGHPFAYRIGPEVDARGKLLSGEKFDDVIELKKLLTSRPRQLARNLLHQFTLYATGTPVRFSDRVEIEAILDQCKGEGYRVKDLLLSFIESPVFSPEPHHD